MSKTNSKVVLFLILTCSFSVLPLPLAAQLTWGTPGEIYDFEDVDQIWPELPDPQDVKISDLQDAKRYQYGKYYVDFANPACSSYLKSQNTESFKLLPGKEKGLQRALSAIGERIVQDCPDFKSYSVPATWKGPKNILEQNIFLEKDDYWLIGAGIRHKWWGVYYPGHVSSNLEQAWVEDRDEMVAKAKSGDNPLAARGFFASKLQHSNDRYKVYTGLQAGRSGEWGWVVIVHNVDDEKTSFLDTEAKTVKTKRGGTNPGWRENSWIFPTTRQLAELQSILDKMNVPFNRTRGKSHNRNLGVLHYVQGYSHPETNRFDFTRVEQFEPPLFNQTLSLQLRDRPIITPTEKLKIRNVDTKIDSRYRGAFLSVAEIKQRYTPPAPKVVSAESAVISPTQRFIKEREEERQRAIQGKYVFKNEIFWAQYHGSVVRDVFDGNNPSLLTRRSPMVSFVLTQYLRGLSDSDKCRKTIINPIDAVIKTVETGPNGTTQLPDQKIVIPARFSNVMEEYINDSSPLTGYILRSVFQDRLNSGAKNRFDFGQQKDLLDNILNTTHDVDLLFNTQQCGNSFHRQFEENLYRMTHGAGTVQQSGFEIAGASEASEPVYDGTESTGSVYASCLGSRDFNRAASRIKYCRCEERVISRTLPKDEIEIIEKRYYRFAQILGEVSTAIRHAQKHKYEKAYYEQQKCRT